MSILIANLHEYASCVRHQIAANDQSFADHVKIRMNSAIPSITECSYLFRLRRRILDPSVSHISFASADLPIRSKLDPIRRIDIDHLHLALEPFLLGKARHDMERVPQDHPVRPVLIVLVKLDLVVEVEFVEVVEEAGEETGVIGLGR